MTGGSAERDWALFVDWCAAARVPSVPITVSAVSAFLSATRGRPSTKARYIRSIRTTLRTRQLPSEIPGRPDASSCVRDGGVAAGRALAQLERFRFPAGLRGRRDGWLIALIAVLGFTRREALSVSADDLEFGDHISVRGRPVPRAEEAVECAACAICRWLQVVGLASAGARASVRRLLEPDEDDKGTHVCDDWPEGGWEGVAVLAPAIDHYGWVAAGRPLSLGAVSEVMKVRQSAGEMPKVWVAPQRVEARGRYATASSAELAQAQDDVDAALDAMLKRSLEALEVGEGMASNS